MKSILLVEDDESLNQGITLKLKKEGYRVSSAFSLEEAEELFVRPRACFLARSFSGSEKRRVRKPKNHLLCKWIRMLQLTEKPPML